MRQEFGHRQEQKLDRNMHSTSRKKAGDVPGMDHQWAPCHLLRTSGRCQCNMRGEKVSMRMVRDKAVPYPPTGDNR
jgi:hypothetical protein